MLLFITQKRCALTQPLSVTISLILCFLLLVFSGCMAGRSWQPVENQQTTMTTVQRTVTGDRNIPVAGNQQKNAPTSFKESEVQQGTENIKLVSHSENAPVLSQQTEEDALSKESSKNKSQPVSVNDLSDSTKEVWTFDEAIKATLQSDPRLHAGMMMVQEAHADWWTSTLLPNPELTVAGGTLPFKTVTPERPGGPPQLDLEIAFPIDWFLFAKRAAGMESARIGVSLSETEYADLIRLRVTTTATAFYDVLEAKELLRLAKEDTDVLMQLEKVMKQGRDAGGISEIDYKRVQLDRLHSQQSILDAQAQLTIAKSRLWSLFGRNETAPDFDVTGSLDILPLIEPLSFPEALEMAKRNRPDIRRMQLQIAQAGANVTVENRNAYPEISPSFGYSHQYQECIGDPDYDGWGVAIGITVPLFDRNQGNRAKAEAGMVRARYELQAGMIDLQSEVREADEHFRMAIEKTKITAEEQVDLATKVRNSVIEAYKAGGYHLIDVLNAENSYRETKRLYLTSRADYWRALFTYNSIIGKTTMQGGKINDHI